jgi:hypothetical protein
MAAATIGLAALGSAFSGYSQASAANYQAQVAKNNAIVSSRNANAAIAAGQVQSQAVSLRSAAQGGQIKAAQAANNINTSSKSAIGVQESQRETGELDTLTAMNNAALQAYGYQVQGANFNAQAGLEQSIAGQAPIASALNFGGNALDKAPSIGSNWLNFGGGGGGGGLSSEQLNPGGFGG